MLTMHAGSCESAGRVDKGGGESHTLTAEDYIVGLKQ